MAKKKVEHKCPKCGSTDHQRCIEVSTPNHAYCDNKVITSKYTWWNFAFKNVYEQFQRKANLYFLVISILQVGALCFMGLCDLSPTSPYATIGPLVVIMTVSAVKQAIEDWKRHASDRAVNLDAASAAEGTSAATKHWEKLRCGEILHIKNDESFPADLLVLQTSSADGKCYIETKGLDGETNLKIKSVNKDIAALATDTATFDTKDYAGATVECEGPNKVLNDFSGIFKKDGQGPIALDNSSIVLRGATLRNSPYIYGMVVYTGKETKVSMNSLGSGKMKRSQLEKQIDKYLALIVVAQIIVCSVSTVWSFIWVDDNREASYMPFLRDQSFGKTLLNWLTYLILYNNLVPISLYVSLELVKVQMGSLASRDPKMYRNDPLCDHMPTKVNTSDLPEDLGMIKYIFSDKTGTLTQNVMQFKKLSVSAAKNAGAGAGGGVAYQYLPAMEAIPGFTPAPTEDLDRATMWQHSSTNNLSLNDWRTADPAFAARFNYFLSLALCHTVVVDKKQDGTLDYQAESPDEKALVDGAAAVGFELISTATDPVTRNDFYTVRVNGTEYKFEKGEVNEFNSARKKMSVIIKAPTLSLCGIEIPARVMLYAKGADMMMERDCNVQIPAACREHVNSFACEGLRTLVVAEKEIPAAEYAAWQAKREDAATTSATAKEKKKRLAALAAEIEAGMDFVGITAIEDKLQDGVPDAIASLRKANIQVWVLTGDKEETAINIGKSCNLLDNTMNESIIRGDDVTQEPPVPFTLVEIIASIQNIKTDYEKAKADGRELALVVDGKALVELFRDHRPEAEGAHPADAMTKSAFDKLKKQAQLDLVAYGKNCKAVIGCRLAPIQKRDIVKLVQDNEGSNPMTLAIGDGANDVPMIMEANIGIGISGNEGTQAVMVADYAIGQFAFLKRLLLVHGRWNYRRLCLVTMYSFYKNIMMVFTLFFYNFFNGASGTTLYETWLSSMWSVLWTFLPILCVGVFDKDVDEQAVLAYPMLYAVGQEWNDFNVHKFLLMVVTAIYHAAIVFFVPVAVFWGTNVTDADGTADGLYIMGTTINCCCQITVNLKLALWTHNWVLFGFVAWFFSMGIWWVFVGLYGEVDFINGGAFFGTHIQILSNAGFWFCITVVPLLACLPDFTAQYLQFNYFPKPWDIQRTECVKHGHDYRGSPSARAAAETIASKKDGNRTMGGVSARSGFCHDHAAEEPSHASHDPQHARG